MMKGIELRFECINCNTDTTVIIKTILIQEGDIFRTGKIRKRECPICDSETYLKTFNPMDIEFTEERGLL